MLLPHCLSRSDKTTIGTVLNDSTAVWIERSRVPVTYDCDLVVLHAPSNAIRESERGALKPFLNSIRPGTQSRVSVTTTLEERHIRSFVSHGYPIHIHLEMTDLKSNTEHAWKAKRPLFQRCESSLPRDRQLSIPIFVGMLLMNISERGYVLARLTTLSRHCRETRRKALVSYLARRVDMGRSGVVRWLGCWPAIPGAGEVYQY